MSASIQTHPDGKHGSIEKWSSSSKPKAQERLEGISPSQLNLDEADQTSMRLPLQVGEMEKDSFLA